MEDYIDILLVEDNPYEAKLTIGALKTHNLTNHLWHVDDGEEALDFIFARGIYAGRQGVVSPKIILLDLNLPKVGGPEVLRQVKENPIMKGVPIVVLTSSNQDRDIKSGYENGANSYIVKPVEFESFAKAVAEVGLYWTLLNQHDIVSIN